MALTPIAGIVIFVIDLSRIFPLHSVYFIFLVLVVRIPDGEEDKNPLHCQDNMEDRIVLMRCSLHRAALSDIDAQPRQRGPHYGTSDS